MPGASQNIIGAGLVPSGEYGGRDDHTEQQYQIAHNILIIHDRGGHPWINLKGLLHPLVHLRRPALCRGMPGLLHCHQVDNPLLTYRVIILKLFRVYLHNGRGHSRIRVGKGLLDPVEQRGNGEYLLFIDTFRKIVGFRHAVLLQAGLVCLHSLPHPLRSDNAGGILLPYFFIGDGRKPGQIDLVPRLICVIAVTVCHRQVCQQDGKNQRQQQ